MECLDWNIRNIKKQLNNCKNRTDKDFSLDVNLLDELLNGDIKPFGKVDFMTGFNHDKKILTEYRDFYEPIRELGNIRYIEPIRKVSALSFIQMPYNELLSFTHDFFMSLNPEWANLFNKVYSERKNNLKFSESRSYSIFVPGIQYSYINIEKKDSVEDFFNIIHEYTHTIVDLLKYRYTYDCGYPFVELPSLFSELVAKDLILETYSGLDKEVKDYMLASLRTCINYANELVEEFNYFNSIPKLKNEDDVIKNIQRTLHLDKKAARALVSQSVIEKICYVIPIMVAIELYYIYKIDPEKCFYILNKLIYLDNCKNYIDELETLGINMNENSLRLVREIKKG